MATDIRSPVVDPTQGEPRARLWTRDEFHQLFEAGLFKNQQVELIEGGIVVMSPHGPNHVSTVELVAECLRTAFGKGYWVRTQAPLALGKLSEPEPDIAIIAGSPRTVLEHPTSALLVVEVGDSTRSFDRGAKARVYAKARIEDYWVVDIVARRVVVHRQPVRGRYTDANEYEGSRTLSPLALPKKKLKVAELFL